MAKWSIYLQPDSINISPTNQLDFTANSICFLLSSTGLISPDLDLENFKNSLLFDFNFHNRKTAYFGKHSYTYGTTTHIPQPINSNKYIEEIVKAFQSQFPDSCFNSVLINFYPNDCSHLPFHSDNEQDICNDSFIYTLSLGSDRQICFRNSRTRNILLKVDLKHSSLIGFSKRSQRFYEHSILPASPGTNSHLVKFRISLTFRHMK